MPSREFIPVEYVGLLLVAYLVVLGLAACGVAALRLLRRPDRDTRLRPVPSPPSASREDANDHGQPARSRLSSGSTTATGS